MFKVIVSDKLSKEGIDILTNTGKIQVDVKTGLKPEELKQIIHEYDGIVIRSATKLTQDIIEAAKNLKVIGRAGSGLDNVDKAAATAAGIVVMNTPGGNTVTTAELTFAMLLAMSRHIPQSFLSIKEGKWEKSKFQGTEVYGKTLGIIGMGNIGQVLYNRAKCFGMNPIGYDPLLSKEKAKELEINLVSLDDIYAKSDYISVHTPLVKETKGMINKETISKMKDGVKLLNIARGGIINEADLYEALKSGKVSACALDVFEIEPPANNPLLTLDNLIATPHLGASTEEAQTNVAVAVCHQIADYLISGTIKNAVNVPSVTKEEVDIIGPYLNLGEKIGRLLGSIIAGGITNIKIDYNGAVSAHNTGAITPNVVKGILYPLLGEDINYVNANEVAKKRGISVVESKSDQAFDYTSSISITATTDIKTFSISGAIFGKKNPWIVKIDDYSIEAIPEGHILVIFNLDRPGVIASIGKVLGKNKINIARMHLGRHLDKAISILQLDSAVDNAVINELKAEPNITEAKYLEL
ncbi:MAG: phosphoglycerate dehydrogenase [Deltaproteobacteria bacterium]|nr:phosphoglycerate dehydrogenase [Deltaproteobacteria bacterium]